jgi:hypothetical protein
MFLNLKKTSRTGDEIQSMYVCVCVCVCVCVHYISVCISLEASVTAMELFVENFKDTYFVS